MLSIESGSLVTEDSIQVRECYLPTVEYGMIRDVICLIVVAFHIPLFVGYISSQLLTSRHSQQHPYPGPSFPLPDASRDLKFPGALGGVIHGASLRTSIGMVVSQNKDPPKGLVYYL